MFVVSSLPNSQQIRQRFSRFVHIFTPSYDYGLNIYFQDGRLSAGILVSLLYLTAALSLAGAGYVPMVAPLMIFLGKVSLGALAVGFLISCSRFDGFFALIYSLFVGTAWILYSMVALVPDSEIIPILDNGIPATQARAYLILIEWVEELRPRLEKWPASVDYALIGGFGLLVWWLTYLGVWLIFRYGQSWGGILPSGAVLVVNSLYAPIPIGPYVAAFGLLALLLLVRTHLAELQMSWRARQIYFEPNISPRFMRNGVTSLAAVIGIAGLFSTWLAPNLSTDELEVPTSLTQGWETVLRTLEPLAPQSQNPIPTFGTESILGGERNVSTRPIFQVDVPSGSPIRYWRAVTYDTYTGRGWSNTNHETIEFEAGQVVPTGDWALRNTLPQTVTLLAPAADVVFGAPDISRASLPLTSLFELAAVRPVEDAVMPQGWSANQAIELTMPRAHHGLEAGERYTVVSRRTAATVGELRAVEPNYPSHEFLDRYTQLPTNFSEKVRETALAETVDAKSTYDKALRIETYLRRFTYDDQISAPPPEKDPVEYFLYEIQRGYCDYYATAMVTMLRSLGIPSRTASGFAEGTYQTEATSSQAPEQAQDPSIQAVSSLDQDVYVVSEDDAHMWVEVYFPGYGWIEFEPTAGESPLTRSTVGAEPLPSPTPTIENTLTPTPIDSLIGTPEPTDGTTNEPSSIRWRWWLLAISAMMMLVGGWFLFTPDRRPLRTGPEVIPILFDRMHVWANRLDIALPDWETPFEQASRLSRAMPKGRYAIEKITASYVRYQYSPDPSLHSDDMDDRSNLVIHWKALRTLFIQAWSDRYLRRSKQHQNDPFTLS
ncbi:MAG: transglutaminase domain-containing protein [Chloroflexota bacterium]